MAIISANSTSAYEGEKLGYNGARLMPEGEYIGKVFDIGLVETKEKDRSILYVDLMRLEKAYIAPRTIRARFDLWSPNLQVQSYALEKNMPSFLQAMGITQPLDTDDPRFIHILVEKCLFKNVKFIVEILDGKNGNFFNTVQKFIMLPTMQDLAANTVKSPIEPNANAVQEKLLSMATHPVANTLIDDSIPF